MTNRDVQFCPGCFHSSAYTVKYKTEIRSLKGEQYEVSQKLAFCDRCGQEMLVDKLTVENAQILYDAYRVRHGIISLEDVRLIPQKYSIGKRPLSRILGWGENTLSRYIDGDIPSKQYSEVLKRIFSEPEYYLSLLEQNKDALESKSAYEKSLAATNKLLEPPCEQDSVEALGDKKKIQSRRVTIDISYRVSRGAVRGLEAFQVPLIGLYNEQMNKKTKPRFYTNYRRCVPV